MTWESSLESFGTAEVLISELQQYTTCYKRIFIMVRSKAHQLRRVKQDGDELGQLQLCDVDLPPEKKTVEKLDICRFVEYERTP